MEEIREAALAYYEAGTQEQKQLAWAFFQTLDVDGDGTVSVQEFVNFLRGRGYRLFDNPNFYRALDRDGNGCLDFHEVLTFFYIIKSGRPFCDGCGIFLKGLFFTCLNCYESSHTTFDLCSACYRGKRFSHQHAAILDNYTLLTHKRMMTMAGYGQPNMSQPTSRGSSSLKQGKSSHEKVKVAFEAFNTGVAIANACSTM
ncbi:hypothetical protein VitviT2T_006818 [Vitis vinifera]|uniref:EF-hand domain-containing protein n=2 Tax=Vitis vinifera TaxID=29760 RepID=A0ABY9BXI3_VITVI